MTLAASGAIAMADVNVELGYSGSAQISLNDAPVRKLANLLSGAISLNDLHGKTYIVLHSGDGGTYFKGSRHDPGYNFGSSSPATYKGNTLCLYDYSMGGLQVCIDGNPAQNYFTFINVNGTVFLTGAAGVQTIGTFTQWYWGAAAGLGIGDYPVYMG